MIVVPGALGAPADRLLAALVARGESLRTLVGAEDAPAETDTLVLAPGAFDTDRVCAMLARHPVRVLVLSRLGAHPDARASALQRLWALEESVRASGAPVLTLRLAPLVGPLSPLWRMLRSAPALPRGGRTLLNPVAERDAVETLVRALADTRPWRPHEDWYEVAGPEPMTLAELRDLAVRAGGPREGGAWEPALEEMAEHRLAEAAPWLERFAMTATPIAAEVAAWAA